MSGFFSKVKFGDGLTVTDEGDGVITVAGGGGATGPPGPEGPAGPTGATGATGPAGPNLVDGTTLTPLTGLLKGNGTDIDAAVAGTDYLTPAGAAAAYQPLDSDLTAIAALATTPFGRSLLTAASQAAMPFSYQTYSPVLLADTTNPNIGSTGSTFGRYCQIGKMVSVYAEIKFAGSGVSAGSGAYAVTLPVSIATAWNQLGAGRHYGGPANGWVFTPVIAGVGWATNNVNLLYGKPPSGVVTLVDHANPSVAAAGTEIYLNFIYEAA